MKRSSLHLRLGLSALFSILIALGLSELFLSLLFERHVLRRVDNELSIYIKQLAATLDIGTDGKPVLVNTLADPRFQKPLSGLYWQIDDDKKNMLVSRSLWDQTLALPPFDAKHLSPTRQEITGLDGKTLIIRSRVIFLETANGDRPFRISAAINKDEIRSASMQFSRDLMIALGLLAVALLGAAWLQIHIGLAPLKQISRRINAIRNGETELLEGDYPEEVQLLVGEVNALLNANNTAVKRARDSAADLAHGLKTPLAILQAESRSLAERRQTDAAREVSTQVEQMRQRIEQHLAAVRLRGQGGGMRGRSQAGTGFEKIVKAMKVMPRGEELDWMIEMAADLVLPIDNQDFYEVFGNLLDNARKWATGKIIITGEETENEIRLSICDDGPGIPEEQVEEALKRGSRLDEQKNGTGLGLSIARNVLDEYGATLQVNNRKTGGACILVIIPRHTTTKQVNDSSSKKTKL